MLSSRMVPSVGPISPATSRSRLVLPQPDGPTMTENSLSSTSSDMCLERGHRLPLRDVNRNATLSMRSFGGPTYITRSLRPAACFTKRSAPSKSKFV